LRDGDHETTFPRMGRRRSGVAATAFTAAAIAYAVLLCATLSLVLGAWVLATCLVVAVALHRRCKTGSSAAATLSSVLAGVFLAYALVGFFSIAPVYLPAAAGLFLAALLTPDGSPPAEPDSIA
jgi:hypothetical protein